MAAMYTVETNGHLNITYDREPVAPDILWRLVAEGIKAYRRQNFRDFMKNGVPDLAWLPDELLVSFAHANGPWEQAECVLGVVLPAIAACPRKPWSVCREGVGKITGGDASPLTGEREVDPYHLLAQDCQRYTRDILAIAEKLAKEQGRSLVIDE